MGMQEIVLTTIEGMKGIYRAIVGGKKTVVMLATRNRARKEDEHRSITLRAARIKAAQQLAKQEGLQMIYATEVRVKGKFASAWLATPEQYRKHKQGEMDFSLSEQARNAYQGDVRFRVGKGA